MSNNLKVIIEKDQPHPDPLLISKTKINGMNNEEALKLYHRISDGFYTTIENYNIGVNKMMQLSYEWFRRFGENHENMIVQPNGDVDHEGNVIKCNFFYVKEFIVCFNEIDRKNFVAKGLGLTWIV